MDIKKIMKDYFLDLDCAAKDPSRKVAWCTSAGPVEILRAMDFEVFFPENHGAILGATRSCMETIPVANAHGYSPDICSYLTGDIGAYLKHFTPLTQAYGIESVPKPDVLVYNTNQCKDVMHWFEFYSKKFKVPVFGVHSPHGLPEVLPIHIENVSSQFKALIAFLENIQGSQTQGKKLDPQKLKEIFMLSKETTDLWKSVLTVAKTKPSPMTFFDATIFMGPVVVLRGTSIAKTYYEGLLAELKEKIHQKSAAVPEEKKRIYWDGLPIWGRLRHLSNLFKENQACIVTSTYCNSWIFEDFDPKNPLESMAKAYLSIFINRNDAFKEAYILKESKEFGVDGVIFHESKTCPNNTNSQYNLPNRLREKGLPSIVLNGDVCDLRCYSDEQSATLIEAFLETL